MKDAYSQEEDMKDIYDRVWAPTRKGAALTGMEKNFQMQFLTFLMEGSGATERGLSGSALAFKNEGIEVPEYITAKRMEYFGMQPEKGICLCGANHLNGKHHFAPQETYGFSFEVRVEPSSEPLKDLYFKTLKSSLELLKNKANTGSTETKQHYRLLIYKIEQVLK